MNTQDVFYFYNTSIDPLKLIEENVVKDLKPTDGYLTNAFGVLIDPKFFPAILKGREGTIEEIPIPANWHADIAEFGAALRAVELANRSFTMIELGCGWGCWMNITGVTAKRKGLNVHLIGVEGDEGHLGFAKESLSSNGFKPSEHSLFHGVAAATSGLALFPKDEQPGHNWGSAPKFDVDPKVAKRMVDSGAYVRLEQFSLEQISANFERIDLLHVDIQGGEEKLVTESMPFLARRVSYLLIGTHSRQIEGSLFDCLLNAGWVLEIERPALLNLDHEPLVTVDGVQGWRNPKLLPNTRNVQSGIAASRSSDATADDPNHDSERHVSADQMDIVDTNGSIRIISDVNEVHSKEEFYLSVEIINQSSTDWESQGLHPVHISYHWLDTEDNIIVFDGERTKFINSKLPSGQKRQQVVKAIAPPSKGAYQIAMKLVQEGVRWFEAPVFVGETRAITVTSDYGVLPPATAEKLSAISSRHPKASQAQQPRLKLRNLRYYLRALRDMVNRTML